MRRLLEKIKEKKCRQISSAILIVCLLGSVALSGHISGVHAVTKGKATPSNAGEEDDREEFVWKKASASDAEEDWASPSDASPSNAREYEQLTLEDDSEPVSVSGFLPVGTCLRAEVITEEELSDYGLESLELQDGRAVFAYDLELWLDGEAYEPEYSLQVQIENMELLEGELKLFRISRNAPEQETGSSVDKEGMVRFAMKETGAYAAVDFREAETLSTVEDPDGIVSVTGVLPEGTTVTAEKLPDETIRQLELPEGEITCAYDIKLWVNGEEYQPEKAVKVKFLSQTTETTDSAAEKQVVSHIVTDEQGETVEHNEIQPETDESGNLTFLADHFSYFVLLTADENNEKTLDLAEGNIVITDTSYQYVKNSISQEGTATSLNTYTITQTNAETATPHTIQIGTADTPVQNDVVVYLAGINVEVTTQSAVPVYVNTAGGTVYLILKDGTQNIVKINSQRANVRAAIEKEPGTKGTLCITCETGFEQYQTDHHAGHACESDGVCGKLKAYANRSENKTENTPYFCGAGIGSRGNVMGGSIDSVGNISVTDSETLYYLTIAGGNIEARGAAGSEASGGGAGVGSGSASSSYVTGSAIEGLNITGGYIDAWGGDNSAACVGGGYRSNYVHVNIYGGTINATNRTSGSQDKIRGAGIGAGGGGTSSGSPSVAEVKIFGGTVTASSTYGAGIGGAGGGDGGGSYTEVQNNSQPATVEISGGTITATSHGNGAAIGTGGPLGKNAKGSAGKAHVTISGGTIEASSESGADIGGGGVISSVADSSGGGADIRISGGTITAAKGGIGGGKANAGTGGDASVTISRGYVKAPSIGGGDSAANQGGSASITVENAALVELTGGIGGGNSTSDETTGAGGYASVTVTGGTLTAQGKVGGGSSAGSGNGGNASVSISGGILTCASIGGGDSVSGTPGSVTAQEQDTEVTNGSGAVSYGVEISGGKIITGTIGGGTSREGSQIGFASAHISGGMIQGQFLLENTDEDKQCVFTMTGGTVDNQNLEDITIRMQKHGGAVYLNDPKGEVRISGGTIRNCVGILGGAVYMAKGTFELSGTGVIENCSAAARQSEDETEGGNGGAVYLANGTMTVSGGMIRNNQAAVNGAGAYLAGGSLTVSGGSIQENAAAGKGGGAYVEGGSFTLDGRDAKISENRALYGAGVFLTGGQPELKRGTLSGNAAGTMETEDAADGKGGGIYIEKQRVVLNPAGVLNITGNTAEDGAGIYIEGTPQSNDAGLTIQEGAGGSVQLAGNTASGNGGAVCIKNGFLKQNSGNAQVTGNKAFYGGAAAVLDGDFELSAGSIGGTNGANAAEYGGGVYVSGGKVTLDGTGTITWNTARIHGGGVFVKDGDVLMYQGSIDNNKTSGGAGGGIYVSAEAKDAKVVMLSGALSNNRAHTSGGGLAAQSGSDHHITVQIGTCETHTALNPDTGTFTEFGYGSSEYSGHRHASCPAIRGNSAGVSGGAFYLNSSGSTFQFFCLKESGNKAADTKSSAMKVEGGNVVIGDAKNDNQNARGNVSMENTILVQGGSVDVHGNMKNPYFEDQITVDIQSSEHYYVDHRTQDTEQVQYRVQYYENFTGTDGNKTGLYIAKQYPASSPEITIDSALFVHGGWHIVGWNTGENGNGKSYEASQQVNLSGLTEADGMKNHTLTLYAIWERSMYTVVFYSNIPLGVACSGTMANRPCTVGENLTLPDNQYQCTGYRFQGWNTKTDGTGTAYSDKAVIENGLSQENGATIKLYAQWAVCEHTAQELTYKVNGEKNGWIQICSCGAHTAEAMLRPVDAVYDQAEHPAQIVYREDKWSGTLPQLTYEWRKAGSTGSYETVNGNPVKAGQYRVTMPAPGTVSGTGDETANVWEVYSIAKAAQQAPEDISYTLKDGCLTIVPLSAKEEYQSSPVYGIMYTTETGTVTVEQKAEDRESPHVFDVRNLPSNSYWKIFAYYAETENYLESKETAVGFYKAAKANVQFQLPQGVTVEDAGAPDGENTEESVLWYYVKLEDGYHKDQFQCSAALAASGSGTCSFTKYQAQEEGDLYKLIFAPDDGGTENLDITVTITGTAPDAKISAMRKAGQFFEDFNGEKQTETAAAVQVNRDSAFTVQFDVADQKPGDYRNPSLVFNCALPEKTTVIMQTELHGDTDENAYWYYTVPSGENGSESVIPLSDFKKMGAADAAFDFTSWKTTDQTSESYRFVTSFANADWREAGESTSLRMTLRFDPASAAQTEASAETSIPALSGLAAVTTKQAESFSVKQESDSADGESLKLAISCAAIRDTKSSSYGKQAVLVLQQDGGTDYTGKLSKDLHLEVQDGDTTTVYPANTAGQYIVPLGNASAEKTLSMRLVSDTYYFSSRSYPVKAELYVSASEQADYSVDGNARAVLNGLSVTRSADELPSVRIDTQKRLYRKGESMSLPVDYAHVGQSELETRIWKKNTPENIQAGGPEYMDTMINGKLGAAGSTNPVSLGNLEAGSYCLIISVSRTEGETVRTIMEVPWYFIITDQ